MMDRAIPTAIDLARAVRAGDLDPVTVAEDARQQNRRVQTVPILRTVDRAADGRAD